MQTAITDLMQMQLTICEHGSEEDKRRAIVSQLIELTVAIERGELALERGEIENNAGRLSYVMLPQKVCETHLVALKYLKCPQCTREFLGSIGLAGIGG